MRVAADASSASVRYRRRNRAPRASSDIASCRTVLSAGSSGASHGSSTVSKAGPLRPSSRRISSNGTSGRPFSRCHRSSRSARPTAVRSARHEVGSVVSRHGTGSRPPAAAYPVTTSRSPASVASTLAWAASSTTSRDVSRLSASRRNVLTRSSGTVSWCSARPGRGSRVHRGTAVSPPSASMFRQKSRPS